MKLKLTNQEVVMNIGETIRISTHNVLENNKAIGTVIITETQRDEAETYKVEITECYAFDTFDSLRVEIVALKEKIKMLEKKGA